MGKVVSAVKNIFSGPQAPKMPKMPQAKMPDVGSFKAKQAAERAVLAKKKQQGGGRQETIYTQAYKNNNLGGTQ